MPLTSALFQYRYVTRKYPDQPGNDNEDFHRQDVFVGLSWDPSAKINGELKVGYSWQAYENNINKDGYQLEKKNTYAIETDITYLFSDKLHFLAALKRNIEESTVVGTNYLYQHGRHSGSPLVAGGKPDASGFRDLRHAGL